MWYNYVNVNLICGYSGTTYESGWYLPTLAELYDIWKVKDTIDAKSSLCGGSQFGDDWYWSSSQGDYDDGYDYSCCAHMLIFESGYFIDSYKWDNRYEYVCCIRVFN